MRNLNLCTYEKCIFEDDNVSFIWFTENYNDEIIDIRWNKEWEI